MAGSNTCIGTVVVSNCGDANEENTSKTEGAEEIHKDDAITVDASYQGEN